jgi:predicted alpha/beta-fold hydrolase
VGHGSRRWARSLGSNLVAMASHHLATFEQWPDHPLTKAIHAIRAFKRPRIRDYDEVVTVVGGGTPAPHGPFPFARVRDVSHSSACRRACD